MQFIFNNMNMISFYFIRFSSIQTTKNFIEDSPLSSKPIYIQIRKLQGNIIFFDDLWKKEYLLFFTFNDNLLALNQLLYFFSSLLIFQ